MSDDWYLYIVENRLGQWYTGITTDVERRIRQHSEGKGARALRGKAPLTLRFSQRVGTKSEAARLEYTVKRWAKQRKQQLVDGQTQLSS
ncbi:UPF0213 protein [Saliniradius amylolyticus]|uniref:UPF0213 protein n=1 Tax=Saliniradius amylolyticus TaxID=2183582 RepID=A0A2S2E6H1_9ALTE|nr:GIY-YIG nuclease family protein [Saliniradius amylolyticus]AWL12850.1 UPF0213 protein [Saliniradius amylolyticus]